MNREMTAAGETSADALRIFSERFSSIRLILIFLVIYVHFPVEIAVEEAGPLLPVLIAKATFLRFSVMILTVMSGFIMFAKGQDRLGFKTVKKKINTLIIPFVVFNGSLTALLYLAQHYHVAGQGRLDLEGGNLHVWCDALLSCTSRPVNYPLYFLKDLFVVSVICVALSPIIRRYTLLCLVAAALVVQFELDGYLILRTQMLFAFVLGAALAIYNFPLRILDQPIGAVSVILFGICAAHFYAPSTAGSVAIPVLGGVWAWSLTKWLSKFPVYETVVHLARYAFPIYLLHGVYLFAMLAMHITVKPTIFGLLVWLLAPVAVAALAVASFKIAKIVAPGPAAWATGGRGA